MSIVTRFAPSPTGFLHIGGARTALFNWLLARKGKGKFILRIEDTDRARSTEESTKKILEDMKWLGLDWDEGPYYQSERLEIYREHLDRLFESGRAYKCFETPEETAAARERAREAGVRYRYDRAALNLTDSEIRKKEEEGNPCVVRFKMPDTDITVVDEVLGDVTIKAEELEDFIIIKSDGFPTYHFAVVVDDYLMGVTHILRGQEHLMNSPKHVALQDALGFSRPKYAHIPLIFNPDGSKMSKRDKEKAIKAGKPVPEIDVHDFRLAGYSPEALLNFIALLGWSPGEDREIMSIDEMTELFSLDRIGKTNAKFDRDKLQAFSGEYMKSVSDERLLALTRDFLEYCDYPMKQASDEMLVKLFEHYRPRARTIAEMGKATSFFFVDEPEYDEKAVNKFLRKEPGPQVLAELRVRLADIDPWNAGTIGDCINKYCEEKELKLKKVAQPIRVAITGGTVSPPIFETMELLGKDKVIGRMCNGQ